MNFESEKEPMGWNDDDDYTPREIDTAMRSCDVTEMKRLLQERPEFLYGSDGGDIWLHDAASAGLLDIVKMLVELGLDVNARHDALRTELPSGAITRAADYGHFDVVSWLVDHGARIQYEVNGRLISSPLLGAAIGGHLDIVKLLVERGANVHSYWHGVNALMHAEFYGHKQVADYLRSQGAQDLRDTTPPNLSASHKRLIQHMIEQGGSLSDWKLEIEGEPSVVVHHIPVNDKVNEQILFTVGLSDYRLPTDRDPYAAAELQMTLPPSWPLSNSALLDPQWNWPIEWLRRIVKELQQARQWPADPAPFPPSAPVEPLHESTKLCCWMCLKKQSGLLQMPDFRWVDSYRLFALYAEELAYIESHDVEALVSRFNAHNIPLYIDPQRPNVALANCPVVPSPTPETDEDGLPRDLLLMPIEYSGVMVAITSDNQLLIKLGSRPYMPPHSFLAMIPDKDKRAEAQQRFEALEDHAFGVLKEQQAKGGA